MATDRTARALLDPRAILTSIGEAVYDWDAATDSLAWGVNAADVFRIADMSRFGCARDYALAVEPGSGRGRDEAIQAATETDEGSGVAYRTRYCLRIADRLLAVEDAGRWFAGGDGRPAFAHGIVRVAPASAAEPSQPAHGLRNRSAFLGEAAAEVGASNKPGRAVTFLVAAIDDLGRLNEDLGYERAETIIHEVQARMRTVMRRRDRYAAYAGNRFVLALLSCPRDQAELAARRLAAAVADRPITTARGPRLVRLRVGAASAPDHAADAPGLLRRAEEALNRARQSVGTS